jgi:hypothetical protein
LVALDKLQDLMDLAPLVAGAAGSAISSCPAKRTSTNTAIFSTVQELEPITFERESLSFPQWIARWMEASLIIGDDLIYS